VQALNGMLGNTGHTVWYAPSPILEAGEPSHDLRELAAELDGHEIDTLMITAVNPGYGARNADQWQHRLRAVPNTLYLGEYEDETAATCGWFAPAANYLESWGDSRAYDGTISPVQPLIDPMFGGRTAGELLALVVGEVATGRSLLASLHPVSATEDALRLGVVTGSAFPRVAPAASMQSPIEAGNPPMNEAGSVAVVFTPGRTVYDGRFAGNAWLQELPDPVTKLTWDNAALLSPILASRLGVESGDIVSLRAGSAHIEIPALVVPGHADGAVSVALGYGRHPGMIDAAPIGVDAAALRNLSSSFCLAGVTVTRTGDRRRLALTQEHWSIADRKSAVFGSGTTPRPPLALYHAPAPAPDGYGADQWAMAIDLDLCTGCSACVVACQAENNIPVVGREGVLQSREMHWIRIDRYVEGPAAAPAFRVQPMLCQHCENAPCEYVCPVDATVHSDDGLNEMVYNRCVGTRFCSNNCPYKVRRFNWFDYNAHVSEFGMMAKNPDVTVRARGVMEKCTFCVQRIRRAQREAELEGRPATGPVVTACQQSCPTQAIVFGSLTDPTSEVRRAFADARSFSALEELGTVPRVRYLARDDGGPA
ncbi:MAG: 4Fe-4S dicluster domain-containing protein, partial [Gemmatimonadales bacterium]